MNIYPLFHGIGVSEGPAIIIVGIMALLLYATIAFRNAAAAVLWSLTTVIFVFVIMIDIPYEIFYVALMFTALSVAIGIGLTWVIK